MRYNSVFAIILLMVMLLNIFRYQIPYLEYGLLKSYIAKNLCVKRNEAHNCCQGKCFLKKQVKLAEETDNNTSKSTGNSKKVLNLEVNEFLGADIAVLTPYQELRLLFSGLETIHLTRVASDVFVPPKRFS